MDAHRSSVTSMQSNGKNIVTGGSDEKVKEWDFDSGELLRDWLARCCLEGCLRWRKDCCNILKRGKGYSGCKWPSYQ
jgi:WD40 repeat protein